MRDGAAQVDYVHCEASRSPTRRLLQQFSATASWSFANHSGSLLDAAGRVGCGALCNAIC